MRLLVIQTRKWRYTCGELTVVFLAECCFSRPQFCSCIHKPDGSCWLRRHCPSQVRNWIIVLVPRVEFKLDLLSEFCLFPTASYPPFWTSPVKGNLKTNSTEMSINISLSELCENIPCHLHRWYVFN